MKERTSSSKWSCVKNQVEIRQALVSGYRFLSCSEDRDKGGQHFAVC